MKSPYDLNNEKRTFVHGHPLATAAAPGFISGDEKTKLAGIAEAATANMADSALLDRANHTGAQAISTVTGLQTELNNRQLADATLTAVAGASTVANSFIYFTATDVAAVSTITTFGRSLVDDVDSAAARTTLGLGTAATQASTAFQAADATLTAIAGVTTAADRFIYFTGVDTATFSTVTAFGRSLIDDTDAAAARTTLGLDTAATQPASAFQAAITQSTTAPPSPAVGDLWIDLSS